MTETTVGKYRYRILALLFLATTINYMDRSVIGVLGPTLRDTVFHWTNKEYAYINISFKFAYAAGMLLMGGIVDRLGARIGYTLAIGIWSVFGMLHAAIRPAFGFWGFFMARFGLGLGESGNFPACIKTVAEWFPKKERAFATGIFNAGTNVGAVIAPMLIPMIVDGATGKNWQWGFLTTGVFSAIWVVMWLSIYKKPEVHPRVSKEELAYIVSDSAIETTERIPWLKVLPHRETLAFCFAKIPDAVWWFYLFWGGFFLNFKYGLKLSGLALPIIIIYVVADVGSVLGGWLSSFFIKRGWSINKSRKLTLLIFAICILPVSFATQTDNKWVAVALIAIAAASHQAWSANVFTLVSDVFPKKATASVVGIGGMVGALAGMLADFSLGQVLDQRGEMGYFFAFLIAGSMYLVCLAAIHLLMPKMTPLDENLNRVQTA
jgi:ACS family hexuronate transporter-like MFS transporter